MKTQISTQSFVSIRPGVCSLIRVFPALVACVSSLSAASFPSELLKKNDVWFGSDEGRKTTACVLSWESEEGSWIKNTDTARTMNPGPRSKVEGTFDNRATTDELRYLGHAFRATNDETCKTAFLLGYDNIIKAQYSNGGWPQYFPLSKGYPRHITFNDNTMVRLLQFLGEVSTSDLYPFVDADRKAAARAAIERGIDCIVKCQIKVGGKPTVWCAQHDEVTFAPALARAYELPSLSGSESAGILRYLMSIEKPSPDVIRAVKDGVAWFNSAKIEGVRIDIVSGDKKVVADASAPPMWARFYDLETGKPFFCDRDGVKKSQLSEIGSERRNGYGWYGAWGESVLSEYSKWSHH